MDTNYIAIIVAAVANMAIGFAWYSKAMFGTQWMKLAGITQSDINASKDKMSRMYLLMVLASLVEAYVLSKFINLAGAEGLASGALIGFWAWLGFVATVMLTGVLFENKPIKLFNIQAGYQLVAFVVMGAILGTIH